MEYSNKFKDTVKQDWFQELPKQTQQDFRDIRVNINKYKTDNKSKRGSNEDESLRHAWLNKHSPIYKAKSAEANARRRLLKLNAEAIMTDAEKENYANLVVIRDNATALFGYDWHIDHVIPLTKGGTNAVDNLEVVPASWNLAKNNRNSDSFWS